MDPQTLMMMQALSGGSGARMNPVAMENQLQMMRRLGSPLYANSPYRSGNSPIVPGANHYNQQAAAAFAPVQPAARPQ